MELKKMVPEVRFMGFSGEWEEKRFGETFTPIPNNSLSRADLNDNSGLVKNIHYGDILIKYGELLDIGKEKVPYVTDDTISKKYFPFKLQNGDVIIADAAEDETVGKCTELINIKDDVVISGLHTISVRPVRLFSSMYLGYFMNSSSFHNQLLRLMQGTKVLSISKSIIKDTEIFFPAHTTEQSRIGTWFQHLDQLITLHQKKYNKLTNIKKAMLEKMFPKNGADVPEIRFEGFEGKWEEKKLNQVSEIIGGGTPSTIIPEFWDGDIDWYSPTEIGDKVYVEGSVKKITALGLENSSAKILPANKTVLFTSRAGIGDMAILRKDGATNQGFQSFVIKEDNDPYFVYSKGHLIKDYALKHASGSTFLEISGKQLGNMNLSIPSAEEQQKIGTYFQNLDQLITLQQTQIEKLKNIKKACLEKMFV